MKEKKIGIMDLTIPCRIGIIIGNLYFYLILSMLGALAWYYII